MKRTLLAAGLLAGMASAFACAPKVDVAELTAAWVARQPVRNLAVDLNMAEAECIRSQFQKGLQGVAGKVVGYKIGLTNGKVQQVLGHDAPISGELMAAMLRPSGSVVAIGFATRPLMEADLLVEVADEGVNDARTPAEVMQHLANVRPFIELPDLMIDPQTPLNGARLAAMNVGARLGVVGDPLAASAALVDSLGSMRVVFSDAGGKVLAEGKGSDILGHPLNAVIWLVSDLRQHGQRLKKGDLISLGSFHPPIKPAGGQEVTVRYEGLAGMGTASVRFE